ncbi:hypothetical protein SAMN02746065_11384 [Desulfocicer vacuolatum DSM 3385]|uniref:Uncharacterized protein n=1 Tax=Desulfocicer vacuolatum DSM 3385 TaxID=1121400 RepID=A0A1W2CQT5_9BACT|nr:DUF6178 family protein [Desulfocicer vacuolatum]SMC87563.1 hypothetical protein SAMN02746065_11384 [Desulfocicer vacuolatum DSM 3385]
MQMTDYQLANAIRKEKALLKERSQILAGDSQQALDDILSSNQPATLIQSFPDQDLYYLMHHIGVDDFIPVLSLATSRQWEYFLDMDVWQGDRLDLPCMTRTLEMLFKADPQRLLRWIIKEKPDFLEYYFFKSMEIRILEHDENPSDFGDDFTTLDHQFYFRFPEISLEVKDVVNEVSLLAIGDEGDADPAGELEKNRERAESLITGMLNALAQMDLSICQAVLMESTAVIPSETEEEQYRLRNVRLAEKGFLPHYEAVGVYQPMALKDIKPRASSWLTRPWLGTDLPIFPCFTDSLMPRESLFARALAGVADETALMNLQAELASLVNHVISADQVTIRSRKDMEGAVKKTCAYLSLGMEIIHGQTDTCLAPHGVGIIMTYSLETIFHMASGAGIRLKTAARQWYETSWISSRDLSLSFLGENWLGVAGGLFLARPLYFDNYVTGVLYRPFAGLSDLMESARQLAIIQEVDALMAVMDPEIALDTSGLLTWKSLLLTLWARSCLGMDMVVKSIPLPGFQPFFQALFSKDDKNIKKRCITLDKRADFLLWLARTAGEKTLSENIKDAVTVLFDELEDEYGGVMEMDIEPELMATHFFIGE